MMRRIQIILLVAISLAFILYQGKIARASYFINKRIVAGPLALDPKALVHADGGTGASASIIFTASASTGQTTVDGFRVGIDTSQNGEINMQEANPIKFYTSGREAMRLLSSGELTLGDTFSTANGSMLRIRETYPDNSGNNYIMTLDPQYFMSTGATSGTGAGAQISPTITASNNQNWTSSTALMGLRINPTVNAGATGTFTTIGGIHAVANINGGTVTTYRGLRLVAPSVGAAATITSLVGLSVDEQNSGTNNVNALIGTGSAPAGNWGIHNSSAYNNYIKSYTGFNNNLPRAHVDIMASASIVGTSEPLVIGGDRVAVITGDMVGGIALRSGDTNTTNPGVIVATISAIAESTHTAAVLTSGLGFGVTNVLYNREVLHLAANGNAAFNMSGNGAPQNSLEIMGHSGNSLAQFVASSTSVAATDGTLFGITASGSAIIQQQENKDFSIITRTNKALTIQPNGTIAIASTTAVETVTLNGSINIIASHSGVVGTVNNLVSASSSHVRLDARVTALNGIQDGTDGKVLYITNGGGGPITINDNSSSAAPTNRIRIGTPNSMTLATDSVVATVYDGTSKVWRVVNGSGGSSGAAASPTYRFGQWTFDTTCAMTIVNQTAFTTIGTDATCGFAEDFNTNMGTVTFDTSGGNKYGALSVSSFGATGTYKVKTCFNYEASAGGTTNISYRITDTAGTVVGGGSPVDPANANVNYTCLEGLYSATAAGTTVFKIQGISGAANTLTVEGISGTWGSVRWWITLMNP